MTKTPCVSFHTSHFGQKYSIYFCSNSLFPPRSHEQKMLITQQVSIIGKIVFEVFSHISRVRQDTRRNCISFESLKTKILNLFYSIFEKNYPEVCQSKNNCDIFFREFEFDPPTFENLCEFLISVLLEEQGVDNMS